MGYAELYKLLEGYKIVKFMGAKKFGDREFPMFMLQKDDDVIACYVSCDEEMNDGGALIFEPTEIQGE